MDTQKTSQKSWPLADMMPRAAGIERGGAPSQDRMEFVRPIGRADFLRWLATFLICRSSYREKA
jgi:hypothetical protein